VVIACHSTTNKQTKLYIPPTVVKVKKKLTEDACLLVLFASWLDVAVTKKILSFSGAAKPSPPSCKGSGEEAPGIEPAYPSCRGARVPAQQFIPLDHGGFLMLVERTHISRRYSNRRINTQSTNLKRLFNPSQAPAPSPSLPAYTCMYMYLLLWRPLNPSHLLHEESIRLPRPNNLARVSTC
jgi:hypothetical protein